MLLFLHLYLNKPFPNYRVFPKIRHLLKISLPVIFGLFVIRVHIGPPPKISSSLNNKKKEFVKNADLLFKYV